MTYSIIKKSQLEGALRLDAEFYQAEYFINYSKGNWSTIGENFDCQYGLSLAMNDEKAGHPIYKMDDIEDGFLLSDSVRFAKTSELDYKHFKLHRNDVLFNRVNSEEFVGRTGIFKDILDAVFASYLIRLTPKNKSKILLDYLNIFLNSKYGLKQIRKYSRRAVNQANVNAEELKLFKIPILPTNDQKNIEKLSDDSWSEIENFKRYYQQAEDLLLEELELKDFSETNKLFSIVNLSDTQKANRIDAEYFQPKYKKIVAEIKNKNSKLLGSLVSMTKGFEPGSEAYQENGVPFIRVSSLSKDGIDTNDQKYLKDELFQTLKQNFQPQIGEILLTKDATPGIAYTIKEPIDGIISSGILKLKLKTDIEPEYLTLCLNSFVGKMQAERDAGGSIIAHWKPEQIKNILIPILPAHAQQKIANLVQKSHKARKKSKQLLDEAKRKVEEMIEGKNA